MRRYFIYAVATIIFLGMLSSGVLAYPASTVDLKAVVQYNGSEFIITNKDSFTWINVKMVVNSSLVPFSGYVLTVKRIRPGRAYTFAAREFCKRSGERFNPFMFKPRNFTITCEAYAGWQGFWYGMWE